MALPIVWSSAMRAPRFGNESYSSAGYKTTALPSQTFQLWQNFPLWGLIRYLVQGRLSYEDPNSLSYPGDEVVASIRNSLYPSIENIKVWFWNIYRYCWQVRKRGRNKASGLFTDSV